jgi:hypothetical protein
VGKKIEVALCVFLVSVGAMILITGVGGGRYNFTTGEWFFNERTTPTQNRVVGAIFIAAGILLTRLRSK